MGQAAGQPECVTGSLPRKSIKAFFEKRDNRGQQAAGQERLRRLQRWGQEDQARN